MHRTISAYGKSMNVSWVYLVLTAFTGLIAWLVGYFVRWDQGSCRPYIRNRTETIWEPAPEEQGDVK